MPSSPVFALILAGGQGRRFGGDKLLVLVNGEPVLKHVLDRVRRARDARHLSGGLVIIPDGNPARETLVRESGLEYAFNSRPERGVAESLRLGLGALASRHPDAEAALIVQADQPRSPEAVIPLLLSAWTTSGRPVARPRYSGEPDTPGHPVLLHRSMWGRADELEGDAGFGPILKRYPELVTTVDVPGINPDINTPADLALVELPAQ
jgi:molybdenum cofactor cytidylyltransferase